jgi:hypothetical protein
MIIEHGDIKNPTGNAVIFWRIKGNSKLLKKAEIVASNFVVSPLQSNEETLMVNFPPVLIDNHDKLLKIAETNNIDLIRGGEIYVPEEITDFSSFYKKQIEKYNGIIREYLVAFKEKNSTSQETTVEELLPFQIRRDSLLLIEGNHMSFLVTYIHLFPLVNVKYVASLELLPGHRITH